MALESPPSNVHIVGEDLLRAFSKLNCWKLFASSDRWRNNVTKTLLTIYIHSYIHMSYIHMKIIVNMITTNFATLVSFLLYSNLSEYNIVFFYIKFHALKWLNFYFLCIRVRGLFYFDKLYDSAFNLSYIWKLGLQELKIRYVLFIQVFTFFVFIQVFRQFRVIF